MENDLEKNSLRFQPKIEPIKSANISKLNRMLLCESNRSLGGSIQTQHEELSPVGFDFAFFGLWDTNLL